MGKQLYRFQIRQEVSSGVLTAVDEADQSNIWLLKIALRAEQYQQDLKELEEMADGEHCESFTAKPNYYLVATSEARMKELKAAIVSKGFWPEEAERDEDKPPSLRFAGVLVFALLLIAVVTVVIRTQIRAKTQTPTPAPSVHYSSDTPQIPLPKPKGSDPYDEGKKNFDQKSYRQARNFFAQACDNEDMRACNYLGYLYARGLGGPRDLAKAREIYQRACEKNTLSSCASLGSLYEDAGNHGEARKYFQRACNGGVAEGCDLLRGMQQQ